MDYNGENQPTNGGGAVPIGTAVHQRTFSLCESLSYREWAGYYAVSVYETYHEHEYNAIRNAAALIDVTPLFKYRVTGKDATKLVNRIITRDINKVKPGRVIYTPWCDEDGKVIDDGTVARLGENTYRWTANDANLRWFQQNAVGLEVSIEDINDELCVLALQGPTSGRLLKKAAEAEIENMKFFGVTSGQLAGVPVDISRTGYTGDLGYEIWIPWEDAMTVWDALVKGGQEFDIHPTGLIAMDVARIEAGFLLMGVDYISSKKALIPSQKYSPYEINLGRMVHLQKENFIGRVALVEEKQRGPKRQLVGLDIDVDEVEAQFDAVGLPPQFPAIASRVAVPVYRRGRHVGKATSTTWSPVLKRMIALASVATEHAAPGTRVKVELTVEAVRHQVTATVAELPFFNPPRKTATPVV